VLEIACRDAVRWLDAVPGFRLCVNVSPQQLESPDFMRGVERALAATGFPPGQLVLEVTESIALSEEAHARANLLALEREGSGSRSTTSGPDSPRVRTCAACASRHHQARP
jgi:EAL domain-containing protein (putative c-di-GMP-specific phosphodiesterase class I)